MSGNLDGKIFAIGKLAKIHHDYKHDITIEIFCDFEHSQKNSVANKFQSTVIAMSRSHQVLQPGNYLT